MTLARSIRFVLRGAGVVLLGLYFVSIFRGDTPSPVVTGLFAVALGTYAVAFPDDFAAGSTHSLARPLSVFVGAVFIVVGALTALGLIHLKGHAEP